MHSWTFCSSNQWLAIPTERLPEWQAEVVWVSAFPQTKGNSKANSKIFCVSDYSSNLLSVSRCTEWGHSFTFEEKNSCMKLQKGTRVKQTEENKLFYLLCSVLEFPCSVVETVGELDDVCNVCAWAKITKTPVPRVAKTEAEEKL